MGHRISGDFHTSDLFTGAKFGLALSLKVILIPKVALVLTIVICFYHKKGALRFFIGSFLFHYLRGKSRCDQVRIVIDPQGNSTRQETWHVAPRSCV